MANSYITTDLVLREALKVAHEESQFIATTDRQYDDSYSKNGARNGASIRVKNPLQFKRRQGSRIMSVQDQTETANTITAGTQDGVDIKFTSEDLALRIDQMGELSKRVIRPAVCQLISGIEADYIAFATKATAQLAGTAGTAMTDLTVPGAARAKLNQALAPKDKQRYIMTDSVSMAGMVNGMKGLFYDPSQGKESMREGMMGRNSMADWYENDRCWTMPNSADVAGTINAGTLTSGITSLTVNNLTAAPVAGMVFTVAGVYEVHPETKVAYSHLKQFVCSAGCTTTNLVFTPAIIYDTTVANQNASGAPVTTAAITFVGAASTNYSQSLMYHKEAFQFVTVDLPIMADAASCVRRVQDGISMRVWQGSDIRNDELLMRIDILYGMAAMRPQWACRMIGAAG